MGRKTTLLVEDEDQVLLAMRALRGHGIVAEVDEIVVSGDGRDALDYLFAAGDHAEATPEFVLPDVQLPGLDGLSVLREDELTHLVPVVPSSSEREQVVKGYELGANSYVTKPAKFERFSEAM